MKVKITKEMTKEQVLQEVYKTHTAEQIQDMINLYDITLDEYIDSLMDKARVK